MIPLSYFLLLADIATLTSRFRNCPHYHFMPFTTIHYLAGLTQTIFTETTIVTSMGQAVAYFAKWGWYSVCLNLTTSTCLEHIVTRSGILIVFYGNVS